LSGDIGTIGDDKDNSYHVVYADGVTDAVFDGFTVTRGRGDSNSEGAGMYNEGYFDNGVDRLSPVITGCTFIDNVASSTWDPQFGGGGGMQ
jgi:hypothetical protein